MMSLFQSTYMLDYRDPRVTEYNITSADAARLLLRPLPDCTRCLWAGNEDKPYWGVLP